MATPTPLSGSMSGSGAEDMDLEDRLAQVATRYHTDWAAGVCACDPSLLAAHAFASPPAPAAEAVVNADLGLPEGSPTPMESEGDPGAAAGQAGTGPGKPLPPSSAAAAATRERLVREVSLYMHPQVTFHADGVVYNKDLVGVGAYVNSMAAAAQTYELEELRLVVPPAVDVQANMAFLLSLYRLRHKRYGSVSHGVQVDCLSFDPEARVRGVWVNRQMTQEEREVVLRGGPASHPAAVFDETVVETWGEEGPDAGATDAAMASAEGGDGGGAAGAAPGGGNGKKLAAAMAASLGAWLNAWRVAGLVSNGGAPRSDLAAALDALRGALEPEFVVLDTVGVGAPADESRPYQHIRSAQDALDAVQALAGCPGAYVNPTQPNAPGAATATGTGTIGGAPRSLLSTLGPTTTAPMPVGSVVGPHHMPTQRPHMRGSGRTATPAAAAGGGVTFDLDASPTAAAGPARAPPASGGSEATAGMGGGLDSENVATSPFDAASPAAAATDTGGLQLSPSTSPGSPRALPSSPRPAPTHPPKIASMRASPVPESIPTPAPHHPAPFRERTVAWAIVRGTNIGFARWVDQVGTQAAADTTAASPAVEAAGEGSGTLGSMGGDSEVYGGVGEVAMTKAAATTLQGKVFTVEGTDVCVFSTAGRLMAVYSLRTPTPLETREVLQQGAMGGEVY